MFSKAESATRNECFIELIWIAAVESSNLNDQTIKVSLCVPKLINCLSQIRLRFKF